MSDCRVLSASSESESALNEVVRKVLEKQVQVLDCTPMDFEEDEMLLKVSMLVPKGVVTGLLENPELGIKMICETTGAMFRVKDPVGGTGPDASQEVQVRGTLDEVEAGICEMSRQIQRFNCEPWYAGWAALRYGVVPHESLASTPRRREEAAPHRESSFIDSRGTRSPKDPAGRNDAPHCGLKLLLPPALAEYCTRQEMRRLEEEFAAYVQLSSEAEIYPRSRSRILTVKSFSMPAYQKVFTWLVDCIGEAADMDPYNDEIVHEGYLKLGLVIPRGATGALIGKGGSVIRSLSEKTDAYVRVQDAPCGTDKDGSQRVDLKGEADSIVLALEEIRILLAPMRETPWYEHWAALGAPAAPSPARESGITEASESMIDLASRVMRDLPNYVHEESRGFSLMVTVPKRFVGGLVGRGGSGINRVMSVTKTRISMKESKENDENHNMHIVGPLLGTCSAYMMMMQRYLEVEREQAGKANSWELPLPRPEY